MPPSRILTPEQCMVYLKGHAVSSGSPLTLAEESAFMDMLCEHNPADAETSVAWLVKVLDTMY